MSVPAAAVSIDIRSAVAVLACGGLIALSGHLWIPLGIWSTAPLGMVVLGVVRVAYRPLLASTVEPRSGRGTDVLRTSMLGIAASISWLVVPLAVPPLLLVEPGISLVLYVAWAIALALLLERRRRARHQVELPYDLMLDQYLVRWGGVIGAGLFAVVLVAVAARHDDGELPVRLASTVPLVAAVGGLWLPARGLDTDPTLSTNERRASLAASGLLLAPWILSPLLGDAGFVLVATGATAVFTSVTVALRRKALRARIGALLHTHDHRDLLDAYPQYAAIVGQAGRTDSATDCGGG